ncbi:MAG: hypothetical protein MUE40_01460 [Anaerolineae bacterium]|jgi:Tol biopolymer transport system component|nr:hypothetical protein [Anaerolineae bacterium]
MKRLILVFVMGLLLSACQPSRALPTAIDLAAAADAAAQTATAAAPTASATPRALPPTFTPTVTATDAATPAPIPTRTPAGYQGAGTLYYIYNGDAIAAVDGDGRNNNLIVTFGVGRTLSDLTLSPDETLLAYVAPGNGSAREVFISSRDGTYTQQVSCLGLADVRQVTWLPDGQQLAFFAAAQPGAAGDIYIASYIGANTCPEGNGQRVLVPLQSPDLRGLTFTPDGRILYYAGGGSDIYAWDIATGNRARLTFASSDGSDFAPVHHPVTATLAYLRTRRAEATGLPGGALVLLNNTARMPAQPASPPGDFLNATGLRWSATGGLLLITTPNQVYTLDSTDGELTLLTGSTLVNPQAAARPDLREIAFTTTDSQGVRQLYIVNRDTGSTRQLTANPEGTITDPVWAAPLPPEDA